MGLESVLKPVKWIDEQMLRQYSKLTKKWEDKGGNKYTLAQIANTPSLFLIPGNVQALSGYTLSMLRGHDLAVNILGRINPDSVEDSYTEDAVAKKPHVRVYEKIREFTRLPIHTLGTAFLVKSGISFYNYFFNNEPVLSEAISDLTTAAGILGLSSSLYIKDSNPKLLDKEPFWKKAYDWAKEKVGSLAPQPIPQPVPVQAYSTLDSYVQAQPFK